MALEYVIGHRVSAETELNGLDVPEMGSSATPSSSSGRKPHSKRVKKREGWQGANEPCHPFMAVESKPHGDFMNMERQQDIVTTPADTGALASSFLLALVPVPEKRRAAPEDVRRPLRARAERPR